MSFHDHHLLPTFDRADGPSRRRRSVGSQIGMGGHSIGEVLAGKLTFLVSLFVVLGCAGVPSHPPRHMAEGPNRLRPAVIQEDQKTRLRLPGRSARAVADPAESAVIQVSWVEDPPAVEPRSDVSSRRVPRRPAVEQAPSKPGRTQTASKGGDNSEPALAQLARYLLQPSAAGVPRELPLNGQRNSRNGMSDEEESPIVFRSISQIDTRIAPPSVEGQADAAPFLPEDRAERYFSQHEPHFYRSEGYRPWSAYSAVQITQVFCHRPLYFEEINVERFGRSAGILQPAVSAARFFATVPTLPYRMAIDRPAVCQVDPSPFPPGYAAPHHRQAPPLRLRAALVQAIAVVGIIAIFP